MVVEWAKGKIQSHLQHLLTTIRDLLFTFESVILYHIYKELNVETETLSKLAFALQPRLIKVQDLNEGLVMEQYLLN